jgi:chromosome segregation ATPase
LEELQIVSQNKTMQLEKTKAGLADEVSELRVKKRQLESKISAGERSAGEKEDRMRKLLQEVKAQLEKANARIAAQSQQIESKQREIALLREEIDIHKKGILQAKDRFFQAVSPKKGRKTKHQ